MNMQPQKNFTSIAALAPSGVLKELSDIERRRNHSCFRAFEVCVFNKDVRACLKDNQDHPFFSERWSDLQHTIILARDEIELADKMRELFPAADGFVIENIIERRLPDVA